MVITKEEYEKLKRLSAIGFESKGEDLEVMGEIGEIIGFLKKLDEIDIPNYKNDFKKDSPMHLNNGVVESSKEEIDDILFNVKQLEGNAIVTSGFVSG